MLRNVLSLELSSGVFSTFSIVALGADIVVSLEAVEAADDTGGEGTLDEEPDEDEGIFNCLYYKETQQSESIGHGLYRIGSDVTG